MPPTFRAVPDPDQPDQSTEPVDPWDLDALRATPIEDLFVEQVMTVVPVHKPHRNTFFRVHPDEDYCVDCLVFERVNGMDRETYWVSPDLRVNLWEDLKKVRLFTCVTKKGTAFLWPANLPDPTAGSGGGRAWNESGLVVAEEAKTAWVRMIADKDLGAYKLFRAKGNLDEPKWPDKSFRQLVEIAFKGKFIDTPDHPALRELRGEI